MALWSLRYSPNRESVRTFRIGVTQVTLLIVTALAFLRQRLVDRDRTRLLEASHHSLENLKHIQAQMIQTEKLVSIGQLAAGAAHEINNPLTGILGYSDLLADDPALGDRQRQVAEKIRMLARRIKSLVTSLLSFARRVPTEKADLDINHVIDNALHLSNLDLRGKKVIIETLPDPKLPAVRGDANQILQVFFNLMSNAVDAIEEVGGGKLVIRTDHNSERVFIEFSDSGPGIKSPKQVFDPFFPPSRWVKGLASVSASATELSRNTAATSSASTAPRAAQRLWSIFLPWRTATRLRQTPPNPISFPSPICWPPEISSSLLRFGARFSKLHSR